MSRLAFAVLVAVSSAHEHANPDNPAPGPEKLDSVFRGNENFRGNVKVLQRKDIYWGPVNARWVVNLKSVDYVGIGCTDAMSVDEAVDPLPYDPQAITCSNYNAIDNELLDQLEVTRCIGDSACKDQSLELGVTDTSKIGALVICDAQGSDDACQDGRHTISGPNARAVPITILCCGKATCKGNYLFEITNDVAPGIDVYGYASGEDAMEDSTWRYPENMGHSLTINCDGSDTCESARFQPFATCLGNAASESSGVCLPPGGQPTNQPVVTPQPSGGPAPSTPQPVAPPTVQPPTTTPPVEDPGFMWHVHAKWGHDDKTDAYGPTDCGADFTGGHYDPTFGCGAASDNQGNGLCEAVGRGKASGDQQTCMIDTDTSTCEFGDQSGKLGRVKAETGKQAFNDPYFTNLQNVQDLSIVFHCGDGKRVACAKLQNLLMEDPRDIPIGPIIPDIPNIPCLGCSKDENGCNPTTGYSRFCPGGCEGVEPNANGAVCVQPWAVPKGCEASCAPEKPDMPGADYDANGCKPSTGYSLYCPSCTSAEPNQIGVTCLQPFNIPEGCENCAPDGAPGECGQATDGGYELCDNKCTGVSGDNANGVPNRCVQPFKLENTFPECCKKNKDCSTPKGNRCGWK